MEHTTGPRPRGDRRQVRIGDAEREEVMTALQDHLAAGRLTVDEYEERVERVVAARYSEDLAELLTDLPPTEAQQERRRAERSPWQRPLPLPLPVLIGLAVLVIVALPGPPFLLFPLLWVGLFFAFARYRFGWGGPYGLGGPQRWDGPRGWDPASGWGGSHWREASGWCGPRGQRHGQGPDRDDNDHDQGRVV